MLSPATPYPQANSFALLPDAREPGGFHLVRIVQHDPGLDSVLVSFPLRAGSGGIRTLKLAGLIDGTPLDEREDAERVKLDRKPPGARTKAYDRWTALRSRAGAAPILEALLARHERVQRERRRAA